MSAAGPWLLASTLVPLVAVAAMLWVADRVGEWSVDGAVDGLARLTGAVGRDARRLQSGMIHHYYTGIAAVLALLVAASVLWR